MSGGVLVTGATGKTGRHLVGLLDAAGIPYRAASRAGEPAFDWSRPETWDAALKGVLPMKPIATLMKPLPTVNVVSHEASDAARERSDTTAVPAAG